jgi:FkbM family methyltransferase
MRLRLASHVTDFSSGTPQYVLRRIARTAPARRWLLPPIVRICRGREFTIRGNYGKGLRIALDESNPAYILGASEPEVQATLVDALSPGSVLYDIGANIGFFTIIAARVVGVEGHVVAFEPQPRARHTLERNIDRNRFKNVSVVPQAVGASRGHAHLTVDGMRGHATAHLADHGHLVKVVAIDNVVGGLRPPDVVKIDVEGTEVDVLLGLHETIRRYAPLIICEIHGPNRATCEEILLNHGYLVERLDEQTSGMLHLVGRISA